MHDEQDGCVLDACRALYFNEALFVERIQVNKMDALSDAILFQAIRLIFNLSEHLKVRIRSQMLHVTLSFDEVIKLFWIEPRMLENGFE